MPLIRRRRPQNAETTPRNSGQTRRHHVARSFHSWCEPPCRATNGIKIQVQALNCRFINVALGIFYAKALLTGLLETQRDKSVVPL